MFPTIFSFAYNKGEVNIVECFCSNCFCRGSICSCTWRLDDVVDSPTQTGKGLVQMLDGAKPFLLVPRHVPSLDALLGAGIYETPSSAAEFSRAPSHARRGLVRPRSSLGTASFSLPLAPNEGQYGRETSHIGQRRGLILHSFQREEYEHPDEKEQNSIAFQNEH
jgi:hypothetical protein